MKKLFILLMLLASVTCYAGDSIKIVVAFAPGSASDASARVVQDILIKQLKKPVIIEYKTGAGGEIGNAYVANSDPKETVLLVNNSNVAVNAAFKSSQYDITKLVPMMRLGEFPIVYATSKKSKIQSWSDLINTKTQSISYGSSGVNSVTYLIGELIKQHTNKNLIHVPYKGANLAVPDLISGNLDSSFFFYNTIESRMNNRDFNVIATTQRLPDYPDIPTFNQLGIKELNDYPVWVVVFSNRTDNQRELSNIKTILINSLSDPAVKQRFKSAGVSVSQQTAQVPEGFLVFEHKRYQTLLKQLGISASD
jgi:tripartite-type tricarboxylate transporter receptor subunit TctC